MRGHEALVAMRLAGVAPLSIEIRDEVPGWVATEWPALFPRFAQLSISPTEPLEALDLRCVVGLPVQVASTNAKRLGQLLRRVKREKPARVLGLLFDQHSDLLSVYDSERVATWQAS